MPEADREMAMVWKIYSHRETVQAGPGMPIKLACEYAETEDEARLCAMRLYRDRAGRISVRRPDSPVLIGGAALEEWLTDRLSGAVRP